jgi:hypothetical protein
MSSIQENFIVYFKDDQSKHPYLVHDVLDKKDVILGLRKFPDIEQDFAIPIEKVSLFENEELKKAERLIQKLLN